MFKFIARIFALVGFLVVASIAAGIGYAYYTEGRPQPSPPSMILVLDFDEKIEERPEQSPIDMALNETSISLLDLLHAIDRAKDDPKVKGIVARFGASQPTLAQTQEIRAALARFRDSKKPTYAFGTSYGSFGLGNRAYYLASAFENIWLQPVGTVGLTGLAIQSPFAKTALEKIGVTADFMQREEYKSFMEMAQRDDFSAPVRTMMQGMIDDLSDQLASGIATSRGWDVVRVKRLMDGGPYTDDEAMKSGLVTRLGYADELDREIEDKMGKSVTPVSVSEYLSFGGTGSSVPRAKVALIYGTGLITDKDEGPSQIAGEKIMGADKIADAFEDASKDDDIKAILFRIDSPGGSPEASETIRRALMNAQKRGKPVFVSMADVAASGGYWVAMNADHIVAEPGTITGSIGVLAGKFVLGGLMQKIGVSWDTIKTSENAGIWSMTEGFTANQRARVNAMLDQTYRTFVKNVSEARKIPIEKMPDIAKGRVWTGQQALKIGLVDELGGYDVAVAAVRKKLQLGTTDFMALELFPPERTPLEKALRMLKSMGFESAMIRSAVTQLSVLQTRLGISRGDIAGLNGPVSAQMPGTFLNSVR